MRDGDAGAEVAHQEALDRAGGRPLLGEEHAGEGEVAGLLLAVVLRHRLDHRVGVGVLAGQFLQEVGDLFAAEDEQAEERRHGGEERHDHVLRDAADRVVERVLGRGLDLLQEAHEEAGVAGLLPHLVQQVRHAGVGEVGAGEDLEAESSHQDRLEADAGVDDGGELLPGQDALLLVGQLVEELGDVGQGEELVGEDLAVADGARDVGVGLDDALQGGRGQPLDALVDGAGAARSGAPGSARGVDGRCVVMVEAMPTFF